MLEISHLINRRSYQGIILGIFIGNSTIRDVTMKQENLILRHLQRKKFSDISPN